jgi:hypothetical protein
MMSRNKRLQNTGTSADIADVLNLSSNHGATSQFKKEQKGNSTEKDVGVMEVQTSFMSGINPYPSQRASTPHIGF